jgi:hypothetical protein
MTESAAIDSRRDVLRRGAKLAYIPPVILAALKVESTFAASGGGRESHKDNGKGKDKDKHTDMWKHKGRGKDKDKGKGRRPW